MKMPLVSLHRFKSLSRDKKLYLVKHRAVYLGLQRYRNGRELALYALHDFYVEIEFHKTSGEMEGLRAFTSLTALNPYLRQVDITEIKALLSLSL